MKSDVLKVVKINAETRVVHIMVVVSVDQNAKLGLWQSGGVHRQVHKLADTANKK